ncbi:MAG TPA: class IV adenylate cyclase [bacterium]|nr:class IV adenylate cyclase [bacterium]
MAYKELEAKFQVDEKSFKKIKTWLKKNSKFVGKENHEEYYFDHKEAPLTFLGEDNIRDAADYLRIRKGKGGKYSICLKKWHKHPVRTEEYTHCDEYEFEVSDGAIAKELLINIGYSDLTEVIKKRLKYKYKKFEIVIDDVKNLGKFIEIELKDKFDDTDVAYERIWDLLRQIGIKEITEMSRGYVSMLWNPNKDFGKVRKLS